MRLLSQLVVGCSYSIAMVLAVAWMMVAFGDIDLRASDPIILALSGVAICGLGIGFLSLLLGSNRSDPNEAPARISYLDDPVRR
jgi:hypothetical protein